MTRPVSSPGASGPGPLAGFLGGVDASAPLVHLVEAVALAFVAPLEWLFDRFLDAFGAGSCAVGGPLGLDLFCAGYGQRALLAALGVGLVAPLVGTFLVHRRMALIGDALAHTAFAGVAVGVFAGSSLALPVSPYVSALAVAVLGALVVQLITERTDADGDVAMAIVLSGGFALGTVVLSLDSGGLAVSARSYLFGNLALVDRANVGILVWLSALVVGCVAAAYRPLLAVTFDETAARVAGVPVRWYNRLLVVLTALVVVAAMQIMGVILVAAMLVVPVAAAAQVARGFRESLVLSVVAAELAAVGGVVVATRYGLQESGVIVLFAIGLFGAAAAAGRLDLPSRVASGLGERDDARSR